MARKKSRKKVRKNQMKKRGLGEAIFFGLALMLALIAFFLKDFYGVQFRFSGSYIWLAAYFFGFVGYLFYLVQFILPLDWKLSWYEGLRLSLPYNFPLLKEVVGLFLMRSQAVAATEEAKSAISPGFQTYKAGLIPSHQAFAVIKGSEYSRPAGPGYVRLHPSETVVKVVNLRRHMRRVQVKAMTSDGIPIETIISVVFQVRQEEPPLEPDLAFPYDHGAIFWVNYLENFKSDQGVTTWSERIERETDSLLVDELSRYSLDQLFEQGQRIVPSLTKVRARLKSRLIDAFDRYGVTILQVLLSKVVLPDEVVSQRIDIWQAGWKSRTELEEAVEAIALPPGSDLAKVEIIQGVLDDIDAVRERGGAELADAVLVGMAEVMMMAATDELVSSSLPPDTLISLHQILSRIQGPLRRYE